MGYLGKCVLGHRFGNNLITITIHPGLPYYKAVQEARMYFYGGGIPKALITTPSMGEEHEVK